MGNMDNYDLYYYIRIDLEFIKNFIYTFVSIYTYSYHILSEYPDFKGKKEKESFQIKPYKEFLPNIQWDTH